MRRAMAATTRISRRLDKFGAETVWQEFTPLARDMGAVNLGQGFPDWASPSFVKDAMKNAVDAEQNQYCRSAGHPPLVQTLAKRYSEVFGRPINWETEVTIGVGATETLYATMQALIDPDDEVVLISPAFDIYSAQVTMAGGICKYVPLRTIPDPTDTSKKVWHLDMNELRAAFTPKTRVVIFNSPQNPTGKLLTQEEYEQIATILREFPQVVAVCDEVYEHMIYNGKSMTCLATLPDMWERTLTVCSSGKTFSCTGWKIGWAIGPEHLIRGLILTNQWVQFSVSTPAQHAISSALIRAEQPYEGFSSYYTWLLAQYERKRDILLNGLRLAGLNPIAPEGGFFIIADTANIAVPEKYMQETTKAAPIMRRDWAFCRFLTSEIKVAAIPPSAFFEEADKHIAANMARFAFCKEDASLHEACNRLLHLRKFAIDPSLLPPLPEGITLA